MIPAKYNSERLKNKNLALIDNKPLIYYVINAAKKSKLFDKVIINSDHDIYKKIAKRYRVGFYKRPNKLGSYKTKSDDIVYDFLKKNKCDIVMWINPISPLQTPQEIINCYDYFIKNKFNSLITVQENKVHCLYKNKPINFKTNIKFQQTQNLLPISRMVYSIMMWKSKSFIGSMTKNNHAIQHGKIGYFNVSFESSIIVKNANDLKIAEKYILVNKKIQNKKYIHKVDYDKLLKDDVF